MKTLLEIKAEIDRRAVIIGALENRALPSYGKSDDTARPHIEVDSAGYSFVVCERGEELSRITSVVFDDLLYEVFKSVTFQLSCTFELEHRDEGNDFRRMLFKKQNELLGKLSSSWADRLTRQHEQILLMHPFDDASGVRAKTAKQLRDQGFAPASAWKMACDRYPLVLPKLDPRS